MHTNSIEGTSLSHGRRRRLCAKDVEEMLREIRQRAADCTLHAITPAASGGHRYLAKEGFRAMGMEGVVDEAMQGEAFPSGDADVLSMVTLNVDGLGGYTEAPATLVKKILGAVRHWELINNGVLNVF